MVQEFVQGTKVFRLRFFNIKLGGAEGGDKCTETERIILLKTSGAIIRVIAVPL